MGAWGTGLYQDDVTSDVKDEYINRLKIGQSNVKATQDLINHNVDYIEDMEDGPLFWFALADTQWRYGRLLPEVKKMALRHIKSGTDLSRWKNDRTQLEKRKKVLVELRERLNCPPPSEKKVSKLLFARSPWQVGDVLLYQILDEKLKAHKWYKKYVLLKVIGKTRSNIGSLPREYYHEQTVISIYNWVGDDTIDLNLIKKLKFLSEKNIRGRIDDFKGIISFNQRELNTLNIKVISNDENTDDIKNEDMDMIGIYWYNIHNLDNELINVLTAAENNKLLIDETSK